MPTVRDLAGLEPDALAQLQSALAPVRTLGDLLDWARHRDPPVRVDDIVTQDEYTHDVLVPLDPPRWLAFDVT